MKTLTTQTNNEVGLIKSVNHTSFSVTTQKDYERVVGFFTEGLGFPLLSNEPRDPDMMTRVTGVEDADVMIAFVQAPGHRIEIINYLKPEDRSGHQIRPCDDGFWHLAFDVTDIDKAIAVGNKYEFIGVNEAQVVSDGPNKGLYCCYLRDSNGATFEVIGPRID